MTPAVRPGVVCLHGLGGTPHSVLPVTAAVHAAGYDTVAPMLPGHGTTPEDLVSCAWNDWLGAAAAVVDELSARTNGVVLIGQSMGATLALQLASGRPEIRGVAAINPVVLPPDPDATQHVEDLIARGHTMQRAGEPDLRDPESRDSAYPELALRALLELGVGATLVHGLLSSLRVPLFVVSSDHDEVVDPGNADAVASRVSGPVTRLRLPNSGHVAALDLDRELLCRELLTWLANLTDGSAAPG